MPTTAYQLKPWNRVAQPHRDVAGGALDMGVYAANLARVFRRRDGVPDVYADPERFFATTYVTRELRELLTDVLGVLAGGPGDRVLQLRTPFGGGKTHALITLLHLARARRHAVANPELDGLPDPGEVRVVVLSGEELDPLTPMRSGDGAVEIPGDRLGLRKLGHGGSTRASRCRGGGSRARRARDRPRDRRPPARRRRPIRTR